jgi:hypothetical protein
MAWERFCRPHRDDIHRDAEAADKFFSTLVPGKLTVGMKPARACPTFPPEATSI